MMTTNLLGTQRVIRRMIWPKAACVTDTVLIGRRAVRRPHAEEARLGHALVLNATYEPLCVVSARRALVLVLNAKATAVENTAVVLHSATSAVALPAVVRLNRFVRVPYRSGIPLTRRAVFARDGGRCVYCGNVATSVDHVVPRSRGGQHVWENVVAACRRCNHLKSDRHIAELGWGVRPKPRQPSGPVWRILGTGRHDPRWLPYLTGGGFPDEASA